MIFSFILSFLFSLLLMALAAVLFVLCVERFLTGVAFPAEFAFFYPAHVHFGRPFGHLEHMVVTSRALDAVPVHMGPMTEDNRGDAFWLEGKVPSPDSLRTRGDRYDDTDQET
jgi:hypothetical protein